MDSAHEAAGMRGGLSDGDVCAPGAFFVNPRMDDAPHPPHASIRPDARLDATTRQKVDDLAGHFRRPRAAVLRHVMRWGLDRGAITTRNQGKAQSRVRHLYVDVDADLYGAVQKAATPAGVKIALWLRQMVRQVTVTDFPTSWQEARSEERSHESRRYGQRFMLRLDDRTWEKLDALSAYFDRSGAEIIRQLLAQTTPEVFPAHWPLRAVEPRHHQRRLHGRSRRATRGHLDPSSQETRPCQHHSPSWNGSPPWRSTCG